MIQPGSMVRVKGALVRVTRAGAHAGRWIGTRVDSRGQAVGSPVDFRDTDVQTMSEQSSGGTRGSGGGGGCAASKETCVTRVKQLLDQVWISLDQSSD